MAAESPAPGETPGTKPHSASHLFLRAPSPPVAIGLLVVLSFALAGILAAPGVSVSSYLELVALAFLVPALITAFGTTPLAKALGGRIELPRSLFLVVMTLALEIPFALVGRGVQLLAPSLGVSLIALVFVVQGPTLWFRHMSLYGLSSPSQSRSLPVSLFQPVLAILLASIVFPPATVPLAFSALVYLVLGFVCVLLFLRAVDRPLRKEFDSSGLAMMRPLLDHVNRRDPAATQKLEEFFLKSAIPMNLRVSLIGFFAGGRARATIALPTVHPGPFGALGASDLPRKLSERLGPDAGVVFVPHTPCDHDVDLPSEAEVAKVGDACRSLFAEMATGSAALASPLVSPYPGSFARAQLLGDVALVVVSQAPAPTDDIALSIADRIVREVHSEGGPIVALIDAHNSYIVDRGDVQYGTPTAEKLVADAKAAVRAAVAAARPGPIEIGVAAKTDYDLPHQGIASQGLRTLVVRAADSTSAYLLIDGNNLNTGMRDPIVRALEGVVDVAEVMTTDNHVVHESDGSTNPIGERYSASSIARDAVAVAREALANLAPVELRRGTKEVPGVLALGPGYTARLLTSIGDTVSVLGNALLTTFLLLLASSLVVLIAVP